MALALNNLKRVDMPVTKPTKINEVYGEKGWLEWLKDADCCFEQILEVVPSTVGAVWPLISHLSNHSSKTNKKC